MYEDVIAAVKILLTVTADKVAVTVVVVAYETGPVGWAETLHVLTLVVLSTSPLVTAASVMEAVLHVPNTRNSSLGAIVIEGRMCMAGDGGLDPGPCGLWSGSQLDLYLPLFFPAFASRICLVSRLSTACARLHWD